MNIGIVQIYDENIKSYAEYSRIMNSLYAVQHNYKYICWEYDLVPAHYSVYYNKIQAVAQAMGSDLNLDWILYIDSDAIITNYNITIEEIIARHENEQIVFPGDHVYGGDNNGVFLIKNTQLMRDYLSQCYSDSRYFHTITPEQSAMIITATCDPKYLDYIGYESRQFFTALLPNVTDPAVDSRSEDARWNEKSFILHLQCLPNKTRQEVILKCLTQLNIYCLNKRD